MSGHIAVEPECPLSSLGINNARPGTIHPSAFILSFLAVRVAYSGRQQFPLE